MKDVLLLWDVDGTLLKNPVKTHSSIDEYFLAGKKVTNQDLSQPDVVDGSTDFGIIHSILKNSGFSKKDAQAVFPDFLAALEEITTDPGLIGASREPIKGAKDALKELSHFTVQTYATGNSKIRAERKLAYFQLNQFLDTDIGGFGFWTANRSEFVKRAVDLAREKYLLEFKAVVIGDTPYDILSAKDNNLLSVAITGGIYSKKDLNKYNPDLLIDDLSGKDLVEFLNG